jgi:thiamine biosynthesis protein ThiC
MIYHQGAATRSLTVGSIDPDGYMDNARKRIKWEEGAEWLLSPESSYEYQFDKEEEVAQFKMESHYAAMRQYLLNHDRLFDTSW